LILPVNQAVTFPFDVTEDRIRFQQSIVDGKKGYYDMIEKKFISLEMLESLINQLKPELKFQFSSSNDRSIIQCVTRIRRNISLFQKNLSDSYSQVFLKYVSNRFLRSLPTRDIDSAILYVDIVGSTKLATNLSSEELAKLIRIFSQEMSIIISKHGGFVLKYAGDAVISYFPELQDHSNIAENAVRCAHSMKMIITHALNIAFHDFGLPPISIRVGIDCGKNQIIFLGPEPDLIGHVITITSKIVPLAKPNQIAIGNAAYQILPENLKKEFVKINQDDKKWGYIHPETDKVYPVFFSKYTEGPNVNS